jgi:hypothetical protein
MEVSAVSTQKPVNLYRRNENISAEAKEDALVIDLISKKDPKSFALNLTGQEIVDKLNEILKDKLPEGIEGLDPSEVTPEKTANRIADGAIALFPVYKAQNPNLSEEELLDGFMKTIRGGIKQGYEEATVILEGLGAFNFEGVKEGIEKTMKLVEEKLQRFQSEVKTSFAAKEVTKNELLQHADLNPQAQ